MKLRIIFFVILFHAIGFSSQYHCDPKLKPILEKVQALPEANEVIDQVLSQGPFSIEINKQHPDYFEGYWDSYQRTIYLTKSKKVSECSLITTLLMELQNALRNDDIKQMHRLAQRRAIDKSQFIEQFEYIEYENACAANELLNAGVEKGIFPSGCSWNIADNFSDHFAVQREMGHSDWIGQIYDDLASSSRS